MFCFTRVLQILLGQEDQPCQSGLSKGRSYFFTLVMPFFPEYSSGESCWTFISDLVRGSRAPSPLTLAWLDLLEAWKALQSPWVDPICPRELGVSRTDHFPAPHPCCPLAALRSGFCCSRLRQSRHLVPQTLPVVTDGNAGYFHPIQIVPDPPLLADVFIEIFLLSFTAVTRWSFCWALALLIFSLHTLTTSSGCLQLLPKARNSPFPLKSRHSSLSSQAHATSCSSCAFRIFLWKDVQPSWTPLPPKGVSARLLDSPGWQICSLSPLTSKNQS